MMKLLIFATLLSLLGLFVQGLPAARKGVPHFLTTRQSSKIVGGKSAKLGQFPYQVSLQRFGGDNEGHYCGGSLISTSTVLTAGQCITDLYLDPNEHIEVHAGFITLSNPGDTLQTSTVKSSVVHPDYEGDVDENDIAIHILTSPFTLNEFVSVINLPSSEIFPSGTVTLSGWGSTSHSMSPIYPDILQTVNLTIVGFDECTAILEEVDRWATLTETMVCTTTPTGGFAPCIGDAGTPLVAGTPENLTLVGISSWGFTPCGAYGEPSVYTNPSSFLDFISENLV